MLWREPEAAGYNRSEALPEHSPQGQPEQPDGRPGLVSADMPLFGHNIRSFQFQPEPEE